MMIVCFVVYTKSLNCCIVLLSGHDMESYLSRDEDRGGITHSVKDARTIGSAYDLYLQSVVQSLFTYYV